MITNGFFGAAAASQVIAGGGGGSGFSVVGSAFTGQTITSKSNIAMVDTDLAVLLNNGSDELQGFSWNGSSFAATGTNVALTTDNDGWITRLGTDALLASGDGDNWQKYTWNGSTFVTSGSSFSTGIDTRACSSSATRVFMTVRTGAELQVWDESGGTWTESASLAGLGFTFANHCLTVLDKTPDAELIAVQSLASGDMKLYTYNGTTLSFVSGSTLSFAGGGNASMARINATTFAYIDSGETLTVFTTDGSTITQGASYNVETILGGVTLTQPVIDETVSDGSIIIAGRSEGIIAYLQYTA